MPYVFRNQNGDITGLTKFRLNDHQDELLDDDQEFIDHMGSLNAEPTNEQVYDESLENQKLIKAVVQALNDGTFVPGANHSKTELKTLILSKM